MLGRNNKVCIVGGGPAGLSAAYRLEKECVPFILLEAQKMPRSKACADVITSKAIRELNKMEPAILDALKIQGKLNPIWGTVLSISSQSEVNLPFRGLDGRAQPSCYSVDRESMDSDIWDKLKSITSSRMLDGVRVVDILNEHGVHKVYLASGKVIEAGSVIIANGGARSLCGNSYSKFEDDRHTAVGVRAYYTGLKGIELDKCRLYLEKKWMPGGLYIAPLSNGLYNVNMVIRKDRIKKSQMNLTYEMETAINTDSELKEVFSGAERIGKVEGSPLPLATTERKLTEGRMALAGDAAGLIDLISANGIPQALISGRLAAEHSLRILNGISIEESAQMYEDALMNEIGTDISLGKKLSPILGYSWISDLLMNSIGTMGNRANKNGGLEQVLYSERPLRSLIKLMNPFTLT